MSDAQLDIQALIFILVVVAVSLAAAYLFRRAVPGGVVGEHNDIAGAVFAVVGVLYAVLLAFLAVGVWEHYGASEERTYEEASRLTVIYRKVDLFPQGHIIRAELRRYVSDVIEREWPLMRTGKFDPQERHLAESVAFQLRHLPVKTPAEQNVHAAIMQNMDDALVDRDFRISASNIGIDSFIWSILIVGAAATIAFTYLFAYRTAHAMYAIVGMLAFMVALVLYLIAAVDYPFRGAIHIGPEAFENALRVFGEIGT